MILYSNKRVHPHAIAVPVFVITFIFLGSGSAFAAPTAKPTNVTNPSAKATASLASLKIAVDKASANLVDARAKLVAADKAYNASPTVDTKRALSAARINVTKAEAVLKTAQIAYAQINTTRSNIRHGGKSKS